MADRDARLITKRTSVSGKIPTGTTAYETNFIRSGELASNLADKKLFGYDGIDVFEYGSNSFLGFTGGTISGNLNITLNLSAYTLFSGSTDVETIIRNLISSSSNISIQPGSNIITGGTSQLPIVSVVSSPFFNNITASGDTSLQATSVTSVSANTINSGSTNISSIFSPIVHVHNQYATISGTTFTGPVIGINVSATTISGGTIYSGGTDLYDIFLTTIDGNDITRVQPGINISTGGTANNPIINLDDNIVLGSISATTISATTLSIGEFTGTPSSVVTIQGTGSGYTTSSLNLYNSSGTKMYDFMDKGRFISYDPTGLVSLSIEAQGTTGVSEITSNSTTLIFQTNSGEYSFRRLTAGNILMYTNGKQFDLSATVGGAPNVTIGTNGYFGIGGTPTSLFHVFGDSYLNGGLTASTVNINNLGTGTSIYNLGIDSDGRVVSGTIGGETFTGGTVTGETIFTGNLSASTFLSGSTNLYDIFSTENYYTTGATLNGNNLTFDRSDLSSAYTVDLSSILPNLTNYITYTGATGFSQTTTATTYNEIVVDSNGNVMTNKLFYIALDFTVTGRTWSYTSPEAFKINSIDNPSGMTYTILNNSSPYTLGNTISLYDNLQISGNTMVGFLKLNSELI